MIKFVSPGVYTVEKDINEYMLPKKYLRMSKICKIYDIIIYKSGTITTSTPPQIW